MTVTSREIAAGNFSVRVRADTEDEVGQLAKAFNRMTEDLEKIENLRRTLMIDVAHELRTPLTNIRGYLEALHDGVLPPSTETIALLRDETLRLVQLVEDVLQLARADAARGNLKRRTIELCEEVDSALAHFSGVFTQKGIRVNLRTPDEPVLVSADPKRIARVLRNLTENAARYTPSKGKVDIHIETGPLQVRIDYVNTASDLSAEDLPHMFERFFRGEKSRSRAHGGAGIGLAIVKELVEAHGGTVGAELIDGRIKIGFTLPVHPAQAAG
jgi:signal transduction histidine kinase